jgi:hypothetical protein
MAQVTSHESVECINILFLLPLHRRLKFGCRITIGPLLCCAMRLVPSSLGNFAVLLPQRWIFQHIVEDGETGTEKSTSGNVNEVVVVVSGASNGDCACSDDWGVDDQLLPDVPT